MKYRRQLLISFFLVVAVCWIGLQSVQVPAGQQPANQASAASSTVFKTQTNLVLVDAVVTDKKGNYIRDLEQKDFKVYEDGKEQPINSFSRGAEANGPKGPGERH